MQVREAAFLDWASAEHITNFDHSACLESGHQHSGRRMVFEKDHPALSAGR